VLAAHPALAAAMSADRGRDTTRARRALAVAAAVRDAARAADAAAQVARTIEEAADHADAVVAARAAAQRALKERGIDVNVLAARGDLTAGQLVNLASARRSARSDASGDRGRDRDGARIVAAGAGRPATATATAGAGSTLPRSARGALDGGQPRPLPGYIAQDGQHHHNQCKLVAGLHPALAALQGHAADKRLSLLVRMLPSLRRIAADRGEDSVANARIGITGLTLRDVMDVAETWLDKALPANGRAGGADTTSLSNLNHNHNNNNNNLNNNTDNYDGRAGANPKAAPRSAAPFFSSLVFPGAGGSRAWQKRAMPVARPASAGARLSTRAAAAAAAGIDSQQRSHHAHAVR
jgi:hypothetical protein